MDNTLSKQTQKKDQLDLARRDLFKVVGAGAIATGLLSYTETASAKT